jgi:hypothetical protein
MWEPDFLSDLEEVLGHLGTLEEAPIRRHVMPDGESGTLNLHFEDGRKYSLTFERI